MNRVVQVHTPVCSSHSHLQENVEKLQAEIRRLRSELDEQRMEVERSRVYLLYISLSFPLTQLNPKSFIVVSVRLYGFAKALKRNNKYKKEKKCTMN